VHSRIQRSKCLFHFPSGGPRGLSDRDNLHVAVISISVIEGIVGADCITLILQEFISLKRKSLGTATSTSNKMYMLRNSQVAVCRSGTTPPRPISSPQQADPAGSNAACVPSWDGGQRVALGAGEAVSKHSQFGVPLNRKALFSTSSEVGSGKASWHPSTASSSTVLYPQVHSSSAFDLIPRFQVPLQRGIPMYPALLQSDTCGSNTPILCQVLLQRGTAMYPLPLWCDTPSNSIPLECQVPFQWGTPTSAVPLQYCTCSNNNLHQCAPLW